MKKIITILAAALVSATSFAGLQVQQSSGWLETAWLEFTGLSASYEAYHGYVSADAGATWTALDGELVRSYGTYGRVDALGLVAGTNYKLKVVPVVSGAEVEADAVVSPALDVRSHDRQGYAHIHRANPVGVGAYNDDGTLKAGARVIYLTAGNAKTVTLGMRMAKGTTETTCTGLQGILEAYEKGFEDRPLVIRIIGCVKAKDVDKLNSVEEGLQIKGKGHTPIYLTVEGVGNDAAISGFGILCRGVNSVEFRNFAILNCMDDCLGFDTDNSNGWVHNMDFFYGQPGSAADQVKGDGTVDMKAGSYDLTIAYNHFFDSGKSSLCGMKSEETTYCITYHHNWFDHSDSRHPRIRTMSVHIFNNYYDGNSKYGVGLTSGASAFVEGNVFNRCKYPILSSGQGTDAQGDGTFSGEAGGIAKAFGNSMTGQTSYRTYQSYGASSDAYEVASREELVPNTVKVVKNTNKGGEVFDSIYNNFDQAILALVTPEPAATVVSTVTGDYGAGRCQKGDIAYTFASSEASNSSIIPALQTMVTGYSNTSLVAVIGGVDLPVEGAEDGPSEGSHECFFTDKKPSSPFYAVTGSYKTDQAPVTVDGEIYTVALKFESSTKVAFTSVEGLDFFLKMGAAGQGIIIDGANVATRADANGEIRFHLDAGSHEFTKDGKSGSVTSYLFYINAEGDGTSLEETDAAQAAKKMLYHGVIYIQREGVWYDVMGRKL